MVGDNNSPCLGCEERQIGCHSTCKDYAEMKKRIAETNKNRQKELDSRPALSKELKRKIYRKMKGN